MNIDNTVLLRYSYSFVSLYKEENILYLIMLEILETTHLVLIHDDLLILNFR
jgi:hypothetical protein